jgi:large subunit ribosomal protein L24
MKLKKGDNVIVKAGKNKGATGKISKVFFATDKVIIEGVNKAKRHVRAKNKNEKGSMIEIEVPMHVSNVMIIDTKTGKGTRIGKKEVGGKMVRFAKKSGQEIK